MGNEFEVRGEIEVDATPDEVWEAIASGPQLDAWFMGRTEVNGREGGAARMTLPGWTSETTVTVWDPPNHLVTETPKGEDGGFMAFEYVVEGPEGGSTVVRFVRSGFLAGDDREAEYDALKQGDPAYWFKLGEYLTYFRGRRATPVTAYGPQVEPDRAWSVIKGGLGLPGEVAEGDAVRSDLDGIGPIEGVVAYVSPEFLGVRTSDAIHGSSTASVTPWWSATTSSPMWIRMRRSGPGSPGSSGRSLEPRQTRSARKEAVMTDGINTVTSSDGTTIAFDRLGDGPPVILVCGGSTDRMANAGLAGQLSSDFTVLNYDRRGRGDSGDTPPYAIEREVEDIDAVIGPAGGSAALYGTSSGAALALDAAAAGLAVTKLAMWEPPYILDENARPPADQVEQYERMIAEGRRGDAVEYFMGKVVGLPPEFIAGARQAPFWAATEAIAHTLAYDARIMGDYSLPTELASSVTAPTLVIAGGASPPFLRESAEALADVLPKGETRTLEGQDHNVAPEAIAPVLKEFFA